MARLATKFLEVAKYAQMSLENQRLERMDKNSKTLSLNMLGLVGEEKKRTKNLHYGKEVSLLLLFIHFFFLFSLCI